VPAGTERRDARGAHPRVAGRPASSRARLAEGPRAALRKVAGTRVLWAAAACATLLARPAAAQVTPDRTWRQFETAHLVVVYPEELEPLARRAAARAEWARARLAEEFLPPPRGRIALVLADPSDFPQGLATVMPWNRIVLYAAPPLTVPEVESTDDWLATAAAHELAHVVHLDRAGGLWALGRRLFGRQPLGFPALFQPVWVREGIATYFESRLTGAGRLHGAYHAMLLRSAALDETVRPIDDWDGFAPHWPAGRMPYAYGSRFLDWLAGPEGGRALAAFVREGQGNIWGLGLDGDARRAFGRTFTRAWREWAAGLRREAIPVAGSGAAPGGSATRTIAGPAHSLTGPRFDPAGRRVAFEIFDARDDRRTRVVELEGRVLWQARRNGPGRQTWARDGDTLYVDELEFVDRYTVRSDLYALDPARGTRRRLTRGARLHAADLAPDGHRWAAVETGPGWSRLVLLEPSPDGLRMSPLTPADFDVHWEQPRWSPDGGTLAAVRWERGGFHDLVLLDTAGALVARLTEDRAVDATPAWSPDGRYLVWSSDRGGVRNLWAYDLRAEPGAARTYRVTSEPGGAFDPDIDPDGRHLAYVAHTGLGFVLRLIPFAPETWQPAPLPPGPPDPVPETYPDSAGGPARPYAPWASLRPTAWLPLWSGSNATQGAFLGALTYGTDYVGRHAYAAGAALSTQTADLEAFATYRFYGWGNPAVGFDTEQNWRAAFRVETGDGPVPVLERDRELALAAGWLWPRARRTAALDARLELHRREFIPAPDAALPAPLPSPRTEFGADVRATVSTARSYPYSVSLERGLHATVRVEGFRTASAPRDDYAAVRARLRHYVPIPLSGFARHVTAIQVSAGATAYARRPAVFAVGGTPGAPLDLGTGITLGESAGFPVRAFDEGAATGDRVLAGNLEHRVPIALVNRGWGIRPVYLDRISATLFADAARAWNPTRPGPTTLAAAGGEIAVDLVLSHAVPYRLRAGLARRLRTPPGIRRDWRAFLALGPSF
jgi:hypothetical protein